MGQRFGDLVVLLRCGRLAAGLPAAAVFAYRRLEHLTGCYEEVVTPVVDRVISDPADRIRVGGALRAMSVKIGLTMLCYARLTACEPQVEVAALAGAVTRLYDDLIDGDGPDGLPGGDLGDRPDRQLDRRPDHQLDHRPDRRPDHRPGHELDHRPDRRPAHPLDRRLGDLFAARPFAARSDAERLLARLVREIECRLPAPHAGAAASTALRTLHEYQCLSRRQREADVPHDVLEKITRGKGAMANLVLCSLVKPGMDLQERELVMALGETLQSLDDYADVEQDRRNGVTTLPSLGVVGLAGIGQRLRALRPRLVACYGGPATRTYCAMIYFLLLKSVVGRRLPVIGRLGRRAAGRSRVLALLTRGDDALPPAARAALPHSSPPPYHSPPPYRGTARCGTAHSATPHTMPSPHRTVQP